MSKYTTELRYICESLAGLDESVGYNSVAEVIENARPKIFNFSYPIFDVAYKSVLETKIIKHFYTREIGLETFGLWKLKLDTKLNEIMPYYNLYYQSALLNFNPLYTKDLYRKKDVEINTADNLASTTATDGTTSSEYSSETSDSVDTNVATSTAGSESGEASSDVINRDLYSDTPQGSLTGVENQNYLTNARKITNDADNDYSVDKSENVISNTSTDSEGSASGSDSSETSVTNNTIQSKDGNSVEDYLEHVYGFETGSASKLLMDYRKTFLNIDMMVINDLEELFMQLW